MSLLLTRSSGKCPCCWDAATNAACGSADCMPFSFSSGGVATSLDGSYSTCRSNAASLPSWAQPTYTAKGRGGTPYVYATEAQTANGCTFYFLQYCIDDSEGTNGRKWVVEYFCSGDGGTTVAHLETEVLDWDCTCAGARFEFAFTGAVADDYGCCLATGVSTDCCSDVPDTLYATIGACISTTATLTYNAFGGGAWYGCASYTPGAHHNPSGWSSGVIYVKWQCLGTIGVCSNNPYWQLSYAIAEGSTCISDPASYPTLTAVAPVCSFTCSPFSASGDLGTAGPCFVLGFPTVYDPMPYTVAV